MYVCSSMTKHFRHKGQVGDQTSSWCVGAATKHIGCMGVMCVVCVVCVVCVCAGLGGMVDANNRTKFAAPATRACSSGEDAENRPPSSTVTVWQPARSKKNSRASASSCCNTRDDAPPAPALFLLRRSYNELDASSWKLQNAMCGAVSWSNSCCASSSLSRRASSTLPSFSRAAIPIIVVPRP